MFTRLAMIAVVIVAVSRGVAAIDYLDDLAAAPDSARAADARRALQEFARED